jgi:hypothetical protein
MTLFGLGQQKPHHYREMLEVHWPEGSTLLSSVIDPDSMEPEYNAVVTLEQLP